MSSRVISGDAAKSSRRINVVLRTPEPATVSDPEQQLGGKTVPSQGPFADVMKELDQLVGLDNVKELVYEIYALLQIGQYRAEAGLAAGQQVYHMVFKGNPGTGKTTVARIVAKLFQSMGLLQKGHLIEVERADLVGEYIGHTALKTRELIKKAMGGILFIDEAYSLARGGEKDFGKEAIDTLVKAMEDHKNQFVLILAGYSDEMDYFLSTNPGLPSRFPIAIDFPDYTVDQLVQIAELMVKEREYTLIPDSVMRLRQLLTAEKNRTLTAFSNARYVRNLMERSIRHQAVRLLGQYTTTSPGRQELMSIKPEDMRTEKRSIL
ncbi:AAA family ATPase [Paenibacillus flagellatus]|uniref:AAA family ATPase n=1 Tax=Paenibacillus flagellatus TaxID=2211139 RepID=UPI001FE2D13A|nr:AAA family ATPase [Paenibacillus flagellatus]